MATEMSVPSKKLLPAELVMTVFIRTDPVAKVSGYSVLEEVDDTLLPTDPVTA